MWPCVISPFLSPVVSGTTSCLLLLWAPHSVFFLSLEHTKGIFTSEPLVLLLFLPETLFFSSSWHVLAFLRFKPQIQYSHPHPSCSQSTLFVFFRHSSQSVMILFICSPIYHMFATWIVNSTMAGNFALITSESLESRTMAQKGFEKHCFSLSYS